MRETMLPLTPTLSPLGRGGGKSPSPLGEREGPVAQRREGEGVRRRIGDA